MKLSPTQRAVLERIIVASVTNRTLDPGEWARRLDTGEISLSVDISALIDARYLSVRIEITPAGRAALDLPRR